MTIYLLWFGMIFAALGVTVGVINRSIIAPAVVWLLSWAIMFLCTAWLGGVYNYDAPSLWVIMPGVLAFPIGSGLAAALKAPAKADPAGLSRIMALAPILQIGAAMVGFIGAAIFAKSFGHSVLSPRGLSTLATSASDNLRALYLGEQRIPPISSACFGVLQIGFFLAGAELAQKGFLRPTGLARLALLIAVALVWATTSTSRSYVFVPVLWTVAGYVATMIITGRELEVQRPRNFILGAGAVVGLIAFTLIAQSFRMHDYGMAAMDKTVAHMRPWVAGYLPAFSTWHSSAWDHSIGLGGGLLDPITKLVGVGLTPDYGRAAGLVPIGNGETSNAMTGFRLFVQEFGDIGAALAALVLGFLSQLAYRSCRAGSLLGWVLFPVAFLSVIWFPNYWFFGYGARILAIIGLLVLVAVLARPARVEPSNRAAPARA